MCTYRVFYWFGAYYSATLFAQAGVMLFVQVILLKTALDNRPSAGMKDGIEHVPFSMGNGAAARPYAFWQWRNPKLCVSRPLVRAENITILIAYACIRYWMFLAYFTAALFCIHITPVARTEIYITLLGYAGLAVEATLPLPQIMANQRARSCVGFRFSVLVAWIVGDTMKMFYFFGTTESVPLAFQLCGIFQCLCDCYLAVQYWMFSRSALDSAFSGSSLSMREKGIRLS